MTDQVFHDAFRGVEWKSVHRTRDIEHENVLTRRDVARSDPLRRLYRQEKEVFLRAFEHDQAALDLRSRQAVFQDEVAIAGVVVERHMRDTQALPIDPR